MTASLYQSRSPADGTSEGPWTCAFIPSPFQWRGIAGLSKVRSWGVFTGPCIHMPLYLHEIVEVAFRAHSPTDAEDVGGGVDRIQEDVVACATPQKPRAREQIVDL